MFYSGKLHITQNSTVMETQGANRVKTQRRPKAKKTTMNPSVLMAVLSADDTNHPAEGRCDGTGFKTWIQLHALSRKHLATKMLVGLF